MWWKVNNYISWEIFTQDNYLHVHLVRQRITSIKITFPIHSLWRLMQYEYISTCLELIFDVTFRTEIMATYSYFVLYQGDRTLFFHKHEILFQNNFNCHENYYFVQFNFNYHKPKYHNGHIWVGYNILYPPIMWAVLC